MNIKHNHNINDVVTIDDSEIETSNDSKLLQSFVGKRLTIVNMIVIDDDLVHYTLIDESNMPIMYNEETPFGFIDADLKQYYKDQQ